MGVRFPPLLPNYYKGFSVNLFITATMTSIFLLISTSFAYSEKHGKASWYDCATPGQCSKRKITASGEKFNPNALTAAHKALPFGTKLKVTKNNKSVIVRINDRGPFVKGRVLDLSRAAARKIGCHGVCSVSYKIVK